MSARKYSSNRIGLSRKRKAKDVEDYIRLVTANGTQAKEERTDLVVDDANGTLLSNGNIIVLLLLDTVNPFL